MSQFDYIKDLAKFGLENDQEKLLFVLNDLIEHSKQTKKINFALQLQSILKESLRQGKSNILTKVGSDSHFNRIEDREYNDLILEKITSDYTFENLIVNQAAKTDLEFFVQEHRSSHILSKYNLPISNKVLFHGPSGCGKTLASYVVAGEINKMMVVVNLGAIVSSKLGETSKNLAKIFKKAASEDCIIFIDEFDSIGKIRDYSQDHGEMKRVVNTILQLFDYLPQSSIVIAATNQKDILDSALMRRFDVNINFDLPNEFQISELIKLTLRNGNIKIPSTIFLNRIIKSSLGLSYYSIQKTLITSIKRSIFTNLNKMSISTPEINFTIWKQLIESEKKALKQNK
jgi:SpoVK/Ycf46/Vps4 family AAA+-type ATPase